jgi:PhnB protein
MAAKRKTRSSARKSGRKSSRKSTRNAPAKSTRAATAKSALRGAAKRGRGLAARVGRTAREVLFGSLAVAGYIGGAAGRRDRASGAGGAGGAGGVKPIPDGYRTVTPYLVVRDAPRLIEFVQQAFGATELMRHLRPDGSVMHAEVQIGDSRVMIGEAPPSSPPMPGCIHLYVVDTDALYHLALQAGATSLREPTNQFYGDRMAGVQDPVGNQWWIATHVEDVPPVEIALRAATGAAGSSGAATAPSGI